MRDEELLNALAAEHITAEDAMAVLRSDTELIEKLKLAAGQAAFWGPGVPDTTRTFVVDPYERISNLTAADFAWLVLAFGSQLGYQMLLNQVWPNLPGMVVALRVVGYIAVLLLVIRMAYRHVRPLRQLLDRVVDRAFETPDEFPAELWRVHALDEVVRPAVAEFIANKRKPHYSTMLSFRAVQDLDVDAPAGSPVITNAAARLRASVARSRTGAIALAGHRGVGKTTAIRYVAAGVLGDPDQTPPLAVIASAPARYDARDFVLYLHALLCREVITRTRHEPATKREFDRWSAFTRMAFPVLRRERTLGAVRSLLARGLVVIAITLLGSWAWGRSPVAFVSELPTIFADLNGWRIAVLVLAGLVGLKLALDIVGLVLRTARDGVVGVIQILRKPRNPLLLELRAVAGKQLRRIRFLQTYTTGWSGKLTLPLKSEAGWSRSNQSAEQQLTYPEAVDEFRRFAEYAVERLRQAEVNERLVIAIDELDKIAEPEKAQELINDIKGIFDVPGCLFLVSVSDDAIIAFERRGIPARDAFDSAFSEMIRMDNFTLDDTRNWIRPRIIGLPEQFIVLCHCLSGGLPRDLRRCVIELLDLAAADRSSGAEPTLSAVVWDLVRLELDRKAHAFTGAARNLDSSPERTSLIFDLVALPSLAEHAELGGLAARVQPGEGDDPVTALRRQVATYVLFCATICEVFTDELTEERLHSVLDGEPELLALARQQMAFDPGVSWDLLEKFRAARRLEPLREE
ncbi:P-loop NTPase fold protein [Saccharopolyspora sp. 5N708]|uniref:P-loop NTPase fold protein n=1 Tax=Saccharopolyspora sp. 5N708 TaxID=3457424 RepID=UPI003FD4560A